ncbi:helix-turn-helix domain-containing protein [Culicoidibacter larvae]|uniref:Helix-turn-helix transcriptional regulator n=1 Tax=Culicoidibacter larvae TaxID=2579976 RepID=A0A5R8Q842_9FIRM|nr:helix-turn-helix transcriptional regulator [Culicoidibacter larvae]TLG71747.1 helix-turn-helix transcriptional regulator [Culicoidibacter larvae]
MQSLLDNEYLDFDFGTALKTIRKERGLKRREVFEGICSENTYGNIENNITKNYDFRFLVSFCSRLGVTVDYLVARGANRKLENYSEKIIELNQYLRVIDLANAQIIVDDFYATNAVYELPTRDKQVVMFAKAALYAFTENCDNKKAQVMLEEALSLTFDVNNAYTERNRRMYNRWEVNAVNLLLKVTDGSNKYLKIAEHMLGYLEVHPVEHYEPLVMLLRTALANIYYAKQDYQQVLVLAEAGIKESFEMKSFVHLPVFYMYKAICLHTDNADINEVNAFARRSLVVAKFIDVPSVYEGLQSLAVENGINLNDIELQF